MTTRGRIIWYENLSHDSRKAIAFYAKVTRWGEMASAAGGSDYTMLTLNGVPMSGAFQMPPGDAMKDVPAHWLMYVGVPDVDAAVKQAASLGAKVVMPPGDIPGMGRYSVLTDPQGATFALWTAAPGQPVPGAPALAAEGAFSWHELATSDLKAGLDFYQKMFGWEKREEHDMGPLGMYVLWSQPGTPFPLGGAFTRPPQMPVSAWILYVRTSDIDASLASVKKAGGQVLMGPMEVPGGDRVAQCLDPNGAVFALQAMVQHGDR